jgi:UDP-N-acetylmuramyl tripeptide synthase
VLGRGFGFKLFGDGKADGIEFLTPQAYQFNQTFAELIDDRVEVTVPNRTPAAGVRSA